MDDFRQAADPARIEAAIREARRIRNEVMRDLLRAIFDGRLAAALRPARKQPADDLPHGAAPQR